ncbi:MAG: IS3 family transposase [Bryobacteraceae bacterium]
MAHRFYGRRRIRALLVREGFVVSEQRVGHLMGEDNLLCVRRGKFVLATTDSDHAYGIYPNLAPTSPTCGCARETRGRPTRFYLVLLHLPAHRTC